jgi:hypothetical protein
MPGPARDYVSSIARSEHSRRAPALFSVLDLGPQLATAQDQERRAALAGPVHPDGRVWPRRRTPLPRQLE